MVRYPRETLHQTRRYYLWNDYESIAFCALATIDHARRAPQRRGWSWRGRRLNECGVSGSETALIVETDILLTTARADFASLQRG
jgi:hypothetical protein